VENDVRQTIFIFHVSAHPAQPRLFVKAASDFRQLDLGFTFWTNDCWFCHLFFQKHFKKLNDSKNDHFIGPLMKILLNISLEIYVGF